MADYRRSAQATWTGDGRRGKGSLTSFSGVLKDVSYSYATRFEDSPGTNPEELLASAHAACYTMALASTLGKHGHPPERIQVRAICSMSRPDTGGVRITKMRLEVRGLVPGIDQKAFQELAAEGEKSCPVSNVLRSGLSIELDALLEEPETKTASPQEKERS